MDCDLLRLPEKFAVALLVINGQYGNGSERTNNLNKDGYDATAIQKIVNQLLPIYNSCKGVIT